MFILETDENNKIICGDSAFSKYFEYLEKNKDMFPRKAHEFASARWHYDFDDHRCPHDSWVESICVNEPSSGDRNEIRVIDISIKLLGAYHDGWLTLLYQNVKKYNFFYEHADNVPTIGHGDWLIDELRLSDNGLVVHEIVFSNNARWLIECSDMHFDWIEKE